MHIVIGKGNLGLDLTLALRAAGEEVVNISPSKDGFNYRTFNWFGPNPKCIWIAAGIGSVKECENDPVQALDAHALMPLYLYQRFPETFFVLFSTNYCVSEEGSAPTFRSYYEITKHALERGFAALSSTHSNVLNSHGCVVRIANLYGRHRPDRCLPAKLLATRQSLGYVPVVQNHVTPTPTDWLAKYLVDNFHALHEKQFHNVAPSGSVSVAEFAKQLLPERDLKIIPAMDTARPVKSEMRCTIGPTPDWLQLWTERADQWV